jgi:hypothetical protein
VSINQAYLHICSFENNTHVVTMSAQEVYDKMHAGFEAQGWAYSYDSVEDKCLYRLPQPDGTCLKCAVGHIISDNTYRQDMETMSIYTIAGAINAEPGTPVFELLLTAQEVHDFSARDNLDKSAFKLKFEKLNPYIKKGA